MVAGFERTLKYTLNFKALLVFGILFVIVLIISIGSVFFIGGTAGKGYPISKVFSPILLIYFSLVLALMVVLFVFFSGYLVRVSRSVIAGNIERAPDLGSASSLFVDGLKFIGVGIVYAVLPMILWLLTVFILDMWGILFIFVYFPLFYVFHLASAHLAHTNSLKKALNIPYIYSMIFRNLKAFTMSIILYLVVTFCLLLTGMLIVTYPFVIVASYVAGQYIFTIFYMESTQQSLKGAN